MLPISEKGEEALRRKVLSLQHHVCDYECMWNGIEDVYSSYSGEEVPASFLFAMCGIGNFRYRNYEITWIDGDAPRMYRQFGEVIGFRYQFVKEASFSILLQSTRREIIAGNPVMLGPLDMYYLPYYPNFYQRQHIPIHYIMMVGFDDEEENAYVMECGLAQVQVITYRLLEFALATSHTICKIAWKEAPKSVITIAKEGFRRKASYMLDTEEKSLGIEAMYRWGKEFPSWEKSMSKENYSKTLHHIVMYTGTVPILPCRLQGINKVDKILHQGGREKLSSVLETLSLQYDVPLWREAAYHFKESGLQIEELTEEIVMYLLEEKERGLDLSNRIESIAKEEEVAYRILHGIL